MSSTIRHFKFESIIECALVTNDVYKEWLEFLAKNIKKKKMSW